MGAALATPATPGQDQMQSLGRRAPLSAARTSCAPRVCIYVVGPLANRPHARVLAFAADASGNVPPLARIRGPESGIVRPRSIAVDADRYAKRVADVAQQVIAMANVAGVDADDVAQQILQVSKRMRSKK